MLLSTWDQVDCSRWLTRCLAWSWRNNWWEWYKWWQKRRVDGWGHVWRSFVWDGTEREAIRPSARKTGISSRPWKWQWMSSCPGSRDQCHRWECWQALEETRRNVEAGRFLQIFQHYHRICFCAANTKILIHLVQAWDLARFPRRRHHQNLAHKAYELERSHQTPEIRKGKWKKLTYRVSQQVLVRISS